MAVSHRDVAFLRRLRGLMPAAAPGPLAEASDGSIVIGRVDTADGRRIYLGTEDVEGADGELLVMDVDSLEAQPLWGEASLRTPGETVLKRHLRVEGWTIAESRTEYDLRRRWLPTLTPQPDPALAGPDPVDLDTLRSSRDATARALRTAADEVSSGLHADAHAARLLGEWNDLLARAGQDYGLAGAELTLAAVEAAAAERARRLQAGEGLRAELDEKIRVLLGLVDFGTVGRDDLMSVLDRLRVIRETPPGATGT